MPVSNLIEPTTAEVTDAIIDLQLQPEEVTFSVIGDIQAGENILFQEQMPDLSWRTIVNGSVQQVLSTGETTRTTTSKIVMRVYKPVTTNAVGVRKSS